MAEYPLTKKKMDSFLFIWERLEIKKEIGIVIPFNKEMNEKIIAK